MRALFSAVVLALSSMNVYAVTYFTCSTAMDDDTLQFVFSDDGGLFQIRKLSDDRGTQYGFIVDLEKVSFQRQGLDFNIKTNYPTKAGSSRSGTIDAVVQKSSATRYTAQVTKSSGTQADHFTMPCRRSRSIDQHRNDEHFWRASAIPSGSLLCTESGSRPKEFVFNHGSKQVWSDLIVTAMNNHFGGEHQMHTYQQTSQGYEITSTEVGVGISHELQFTLDLNSAGQWTFSWSDENNSQGSGTCSNL